MGFIIYFFSLCKHRVAALWYPLLTSCQWCRKVCGPHNIRLLAFFVWVWVHVKPACTSSSLHAFPLLQCALDSILPPGPNPLISMPGQHGGGGGADWTGEGQGPEVTPGSIHFLRLSQPHVLMQCTLSLLLTKGDDIFPSPICSPSMLLP